MAAGLAGAAALKAKQERLLEQLRRAKESFRPPRRQYSSEGGGPGTSGFPAGTP